MGYCFNCGNKVADSDSFCDGCGTSLVEERIAVKDNEAFAGNGYILTNIETLASKLNASKANVTASLNQFIEGKKESGVRYELIDVSDYHPKLPGNKKRVRLSPAEGWETHQRLLMDSYFYDLNERQKDVYYLFIIGGHDIIPMPSFPHYFDEDEKTIETDIPYSYLYGSRTQEMMQDGSVVVQSQMLFTGRLPLPEDASFSMLDDYLRRAVSISISGLNITDAYGQCDPHWKKVSTVVTQELRSYNLLPEYNQNDPNYIHNSLFVTPNVVLANIDKFFDTESWLYYFNMHGSNYPNQSGFVGVSLTDDKPYIGISPQEMASAEVDNIVVTEACYGAKFIGRRRNESMLLSSLYTKTILYLGSSRIAYGAVDSVREDEIRPSNADIMAFTFIRALMQGYDAGAALYLARRDVLYSYGELHPVALTTVTEFNIFGDPTLNMIGMQEAAKTTSKTVTREPFLNPSGATRFQVSKEFDCRKESSILFRVRQAVNSNIQQIHEIINQHLNSHYNIRPRQLDAVIAITYTGGKKLFLYQYDDACGKVYVETDEKNEIIKVVTSKIHL